MKLLLALPVLLILFVIGGVEIEQVFAGGEAYQNRANAYWLQVYITMAVIVGIVVTISIIVYKFMKGKLSIYKKTTDMRRSKI